MQRRGTAHRFFPAQQPTRMPPEMMPVDPVAPPIRMPPEQGPPMPVDPRVGGGFTTMPPVNPLDGLAGAVGLGGQPHAMPPVGGSAGGGHPLEALSGAAPQPWRNGGPSGNPLEGLTPGMGTDVQTPGARAVPAQSHGMSQVTKKRPGGRMY